MSPCAYIAVVVSLVGIFLVWGVFRVASAMEFVADEHAMERDALARRGRR